jgi:transcriptional regulator with XRE-family HTH domain
LVADLIATKPEATQRCRTFAEGIKAFFSGVVLLTDGSLSKAATLLGVEKGQFHGWLHGNHLPRLEALVSIAKILGCPIANILNGDVPTVIPTPLPLHRKSGKEKRAQRNSKLLIRKKLECLLTLSPPLSISQAGWLIGMNNKSLREHFPDLYLEFIERFRISYREAAKARRQERIRVILEAARELARQGKLPTRRRLSETLAGRLGSFTPEDRGTLNGICQQVRKEFGFLQ